MEVSESWRQDIGIHDFYDEGPAPIQFIMVQGCELPLDVKIYCDNGEEILFSDEKLKEWNSIIGYPNWKYSKSEVDEK